MVVTVFLAGSRVRLHLILEVSRIHRSRCRRRRRFLLLLLCCFFCCCRCRRCHRASVFIHHHVFSLFEFRCSISRSISLVNVVRLLRASPSPITLFSSSSPLLCFFCRKPTAKAHHRRHVRVVESDIIITVVQSLDWSFFDALFFIIIAQRAQRRFQKKDDFDVRYVLRAMAKAQSSLLPSSSWSSWSSSLPRCWTTAVDKCYNDINVSCQC